MHISTNRVKSSWHFYTHLAAWKQPFSDTIALDLNLWIINSVWKIKRGILTNSIKNKVRYDTILTDWGVRKTEVHVLKVFFILFFMLGHVLHFSKHHSLLLEDNSSFYQPIITDWVLNAYAIHNHHFSFLHFCHLYNSIKKQKECT